MGEAPSRICLACQERRAVGGMTVYTSGYEATTITDLFAALARAAVPLLIDERAAAVAAAGTLRGGVADRCRVDYLHHKALGFKPP